jgi:hypothetical protein
VTSPRGLSAWLLLVLCLVSACEAETRSVAATQVVVRIEASAQIRAAAKVLRIRAAVQAQPGAKWSERKPVEVRVGELKPGQTEFWPVDIPISPANPEAPPRLVEVVIEAAASADAEPLVQARVLTGFVKASERMLRVTLDMCGDLELGSLCESDSQCHGPDCRSCQDGACADETEIVAADTLDALGPAEYMDAGPVPIRDSGMDADTGPDAQQDATVDAGMDWSEPVRVDTGDTTVEEAVAASNEAGDTVIAYRQLVPTSGFVWLRRFVDGAWKEQPFAANGLAAKESEPAGRLAVGIDEAANVQLLYRNGQPKTLWLKWAGESSLTEVQGPLGAQLLADYPLLGMTENGQAIALWLATPAQGDGYEIFSNRFTSGMQEYWETPLLLGQTDSRVAQSSGFARNRKGDFVAFYGAARTQTNGAAAPSKVHSIVGTGSAVSAQVAFSVTTSTFPSELLSWIDSAGNAIVVYISGATSTQQQLYWSRRAAGADAWSAPALLDQQYADTGQLTATADEGAALLWQLRTGSGPARSQIMVRRYSTAAGWGEDEPINEELDTARRSMKLTAAPAGGLVVAWTEPADEDGSEQLRVRRCTKAGKWSEPEVVRNDLPVGVALVQAAVDSAGRVLLVWSQPAEDDVRQLLWSRSAR